MQAKVKRSSTAACSSATRPNDLKYLRQAPGGADGRYRSARLGRAPGRAANLARVGVDIQGATHCPEEDALTSLRLLKYHIAHGGRRRCAPRRRAGVCGGGTARGVSKLPLPPSRRSLPPPTPTRREQRSLTLRVPWSRVAQLVAQVVQERRPAGDGARLPAVARSRSAAPSTATRRISSCPPSRAASTTTATSRPRERRGRRRRGRRRRAAAARPAAQRRCTAAGDEPVRAACEAGLTTPPAPALCSGRWPSLAGGGAPRPPYDAALRRAERCCAPPKARCRRTSGVALAIGCSWSGMGVPLCGGVRYVTTLVLGTRPWRSAARSAALGPALSAHRRALVVAEAVEVERRAAEDA